MFKRLWPIFGLLLVLIAIPIVALAAQAETPTMESSVTDLLLYAVGLASAAILGGLKTFTDQLDLKISNWIKPAFPLIVFALNFVLPWIGAQLGIAEIPAGEILAAAPWATLVGITAREILRRWMDRNKPPEPAFK